MKILNSLITIIYGVVAAYTTYMAIMHLFVFFANRQMGHSESFRLPLIYLICAILFGTTTFVGYKIWGGHSIHFILKAIYYLPVTAIILYALWAVIILISAGGKWN